MVAVNDLRNALRDARWYPADLDVARGVYQLLPIDEDIVERATFMDTRLQADFSTASLVQLDAVAAAVERTGVPCWLLHTSFCCSTLLMRALHLPPTLIALKEPLVLRRLSDARHARISIDGWIDPTVALLSRPWQPGSRVLVKPTHAALNITTELMAAAPASRAVALTSSLDDFLVSNIKKTTETRSRIPALVERAMQAGTLQYRLPRAASSPPSWLAAAGLQWAAQRELLLDIATATVGRVRVIDAQDLLADMPATVAACLAWWGVEVDAGRLVERIDAVSGTHAKATQRAYDGQARRHEVAMLEQAYAAELRDTRAWLDRTVLPYLRPQALDLSTGQHALHAAEF